MPGARFSDPDGAREERIYRKLVFLIVLSALLAVADAALL